MKAAEEFTGKCFRDISGHSEKQLSKSDIEEKQKEGYVRHEELFKWYYKEFNQTAIHAVVAGRLKQL